jgi:mannose/fructose/N-acetylgalactosamine-specific phosphotransferase system component IIC
MDKKHAFQLAISQPLITSTLLGLLMNALVPAMYFGLLVQLLWLGNLPFGASKTPEGNIASVIGCWLYINYNELYAEHGHLIILILFLFIIAISFIASKTETYLRNINVHFFDKVYESVSDKAIPKIGRVIFKALAIQLLANWIIILAGLFVGHILLQNLLGYMSADLADIWQFVEVAVWGIGVGLVLSVYKDIKLKKIITGIALITFVTLWIM